MAIADDLTPADRAALARRLRSFRDMHELTQAVVAEACFVTQPAVSAWERGTKLPTRPTQHRLAELYRAQHSMLFVELIRAEQRAAA